MREVRKLHNQDLRADLVWSVNSEKIESRPGDFPGCCCLRVAASSSGMKGPEMLFPSGDGTFHRSDSSLLICLLDSRLPVLCSSFFTSCEAMEFAEMGHKRGVTRPASTFINDAARSGA